MDHTEMKTRQLLRSIEGKRIPYDTAYHHYLHDTPGVRTFPGFEDQIFAILVHRLIEQKLLGFATDTVDGFHVVKELWVTDQGKERLKAPVQ